MITSVPHMPKDFEVHRGEGSCSQSRACPHSRGPGVVFWSIVGGAGIAEIVFGRPGLGKFLIDAILQRDYPLSQALILVFLVAVIGINFITDTLYGLPIHAFAGSRG